MWSPERFSWALCLFKGCQERLRLPLPHVAAGALNTFDGLLFHSEYLLAHSWRPQGELPERNVSKWKHC
jgi:hypothetical protein